MNKLSLRTWILVVAFVLLIVQPLSAQDEPLNIRIGVQRGTLFNIPELYDQLVEALNLGLGREVTVELLLFTSGPPLLEAFNSDSIDIGGTGDTPPIFAQAAGVPLVYVASQVSSSGSAVLVPENSTIESLADLAGKKVAFAPGSSSHYLTIRSLREAGLDYPDIEPILLQPGEARAAFDGGSVDAWTIWDPFYTIAVNEAQAKVIFDSAELEPTRGYQLASQAFVAEHPDAVQIILEQVQAASLWSVENVEKYAAFMEETSGVPAQVWLDIREQRDVADLEYINQDIIDGQQAVADVFAELEIIPEQIDVSASVWVPEGIDLAEGGYIGERINE